MEHRSKEQLRRAAAYCGGQPCATAPMSQRERLRRWAHLLEQRGNRSVNAFAGTEYVALAVRNATRCAGSPIAIAFADPVLRGEGLRDDTYGEARRFFGLSDAKLHGIVCDCMSGPTMSARAAAWRVRAAIPRKPANGFLARAWRILTG